MQKLYKKFKYTLSTNFYHFYRFSNIFFIFLFTDGISSPLENCKFRMILFVI